MIFFSFRSLLILGYDVSCRPMELRLLRELFARYRSVVLYTGHLHMADMLHVRHA